MPPPADGFAARLVLGPALRTQPDRRLVALVRDGYEVAFEEIVRRYGKPLGRYAAAIVGSRADDVTQDAFSKALLALRRDGAEIELRPWLFRIVRNTALNELRDSPPSAEALAEAISGGRNPAEELERREELTDLMERLKSLPEPQRAAIVMRELEGLSHEEIATALGLSGGAARQAIYRARRALRNGLGLLLPLPLLKLLMAGTAAAPEAAAGAAGLGGAAGAGVALKTATATVLVAGAVGAGVAVHGDRQDRATTETQPERIVEEGPSAAERSTAREEGSGDDGSGDGQRHGGEDSSGRSGGEGSNRGPGGGDDDRETDDDHGGRSGSSGPGSDDEDEDDDRDRSGHSGQGSSSGPGSGGSASLGGSGSNSGPGSGGSGGGSGSSSGSGSGDVDDGVSGDVDNSGSGSGGAGDSELDDSDPEDSSGPGSDGLSVEAEDAD
jgi:RNA polymerase sigma factor (sigma-70 family)